jgi:hypothetical protein
MQIRGAREQRLSQAEFGNEAGEAPHINGRRVASFKDDLRCPVVP